MSLILELVEGETLEQRISRGPISVEACLKLALQIAEALEAAHEKRIIHRDLKPANVKITPQGQVKILDFGLAKVWKPEVGQAGDLSDELTLTAQMGKTGMIQGTIAYMSPEQARGHASGKQADIWTFGVVLWEMLTNRKLFEGETLSDILAGVLRGGPDWTALSADTPRPTRSLLQRCLEKDTRRRLHDVADARIEIEVALEELTASETGAPEERYRAPLVNRRERLAWTMVALLLVIVAGFTYVLITTPRGITTPHKIRLATATTSGVYYPWESESPSLVSCVRSFVGKSAPGFLGFRSRSWSS